MGARCNVRSNLALRNKSAVALEHKLNRMLYRDDVFRIALRDLIDESGGCG
jgi:hypothetical protein